MLKGLKSAFTKLFNAVKSLFTPEGQAKAAAALGKAEGLVETALPIVEMIAQLTPTKADDEIIAVVKTYCNLTNVPTGPLTDQQKGDLLFQAATTQLEKVVVNKTGITQSVIDLAVQLSYTAYKASVSK